MASPRAVVTARLSMSSHTKGPVAALSALSEGVRVSDSVPALVTGCPRSVGGQINNDGSSLGPFPNLWPLSPGGGSTRQDAARTQHRHRHPTGIQWAAIWGPNWPARN